MLLERLSPSGLGFPLGLLPVQGLEVGEPAIDPKSIRQGGRQFTLTHEGQVPPNISASGFTTVNPRVALVHAAAWEQPKSDDGNLIGVVREVMRRDPEECITLHAERRDRRHCFELSWFLGYLPTGPTTTEETVAGNLSLVSTEYVETPLSDNVQPIISVEVLLSDDCQPEVKVHNATKLEFIPQSGAELIVAVFGRIPDQLMRISPHSVRKVNMPAGDVLPGVQDFSNRLGLDLTRATKEGVDAIRP